MTELSQQIFERYQVRKTRKQKDAFLKLMQSHFPEATTQQGRFPKYKNLVIGDVETAKVVLTAHYDTCAQMLLPNFITPKNMLLSILYSFVIVIPMFVVAFLLGLLMGFLQIPAEIARWIILGCYFLFLYILIAGPANPNTANDNTSGVITLCELYACLEPSQRRKVAIVFFDMEESGLWGSAGFRKQYKEVMKQKLLINFDCIGDGDTMLLAVSKAAREKYAQQIDNSFIPPDNKSVMLAKAEKVYYPSDQMGFKESVAVAALKHKPFLGYYMDRIHTKRDTQLDKENIKLLCEGVLRFIKML